MRNFLHPPTSLESWNNIAHLLEQVSSRTGDSDALQLFMDTLQSVYQLLVTKGSSNNFSEIREMFELLDPMISGQFLHTSFPAMCRDILSYLASTFEIDYLPSSFPRSIEFDANDVYVLVSMCFMGIPWVHPNNQTTLRDGTCIYMFSNRPKQVAKLTCFLNYFNVVVAARQNILNPQACELILRRRIVLERCVLEKTHGAEWWMHECKQPLSEVQYMQKYMCIESAHHAVQADFANKHIGGGVLRTGCVQEEIRFMISPETLLSVFLCDPLADNEAVIIRNTIQISSYSGYSQSFKCTGFSKGIMKLFSGNQDEIPSDDIVCIDATPYTSGEERLRQFSLHAIVRELEKCRCGLSYLDPKPFATGNWGCGVFGGDSQLKAVIQWLAASACSKDILYFPFDDFSTNQLPELAKYSRGLAVCDLFDVLIKCISDNTCPSTDLVASMIARVRNKARNQDP